MRKFFGLSSSHKKQYTFNPALDSLKGPGPFGGSAGSPGGFVIPSMHPYGQHYATGESGFAPPPYFPNDPSLVDSSSGGIVFPLPGNIHSSNSNEFTRRTPQYYQTPMRKESVEDALRMLQRYNTILLVDDSASMGQDNLWQQTEMAFEKLAEIAKFYDKDGIEVYFFSSEIHGKNLKEFAEIQGLFRSVTPNADYTAMGEKLDKILRVYLAELELAHSKDPVNFGGIKPVNIIVITDGVASDDPESPIAQAAGRLDKLNFPMDQIGIQFVQVGNDPLAAKFLKELDEGLHQRHGPIRDIVDTTPYDLTGGVLGSETLIKILLGGINKRQDRKSNTKQQQQ